MAGDTTTAQSSSRTAPTAIPVSDVVQLRVVVTPWRSGHVTVDVIRRGRSRADHWDRRTGHLDLDVDPLILGGLSTRELLNLLANAPLA